jgi:hypothetical protein
MEVSGASDDAEMEHIGNEAHVGNDDEGGTRVAPANGTWEYKALPLRDRVFHLFEGRFPHAYTNMHPYWTTASKVMQYVTSTMICLSCILLLIQTLPEYYMAPPVGLSAVEGIVMTYFFIEYVTRLVTARRRIIFLTSFEKVVDFIATAPYVLIMFEITGSKREVSLAATVRLLRVLSLAKRSSIVRALAVSVAHTVEGLQLLAYLLVICISMFSTAMYYAERMTSTFNESKGLWIRSDGNVSPFQSIFHSMWWCVVSLTTTGYGDEVPISALGKLVGAMTVVTGVLVLSFPTVILGGNFQEALAKRRKEKELKGIASSPRSPSSRWSSMKQSLEDLSHKATTAIAPQSPLGAVTFNYPGGRNGIVVRTFIENTATYDAVLLPMREHEGVTVTPSYPTGAVVIVPVLLHNQESTELAYKALRAQPIPAMVPLSKVGPRPISRVHVALDCDNAEWSLMCGDYKAPSGTLPVVLRCATVPDIPDFLRHMKFRIEVFYEGTSHCL